MPVPVHDAPVRISDGRAAYLVALGVGIAVALVLCTAAGLVAVAMAFMRTQPDCGLALAGFVAL